MKEEYFSISNIYNKAEEILNKSYMTSGRTRSEEISTEKCALLILDMQDYFLSDQSKAYIPSSPAIIPNLVTLTETLSSYKIPIIYTKHLNTKDNAGMMGVWWQRLIESSNPLSNITKTRYDAFWDTSLNDILKKNSVTNLFVAGVMTNLCVETTIRTAFQHGYECTLLVDGTVAYNYELHQASCMNLSFGFCKLNLVSEIIGAFDGREI